MTLLDLLCRKDRSWETQIEKNVVFEYELIMKRMFITLFLLLNLPPAWSTSLSIESLQEEEETLENDIEALEANTQNFSQLVKSTMDLLAPETEMTQATEINAKAKSHPKY